MKKLTTQEACNVLSAWTVLEILTPQTFKKPEDLVGGNQKLIASLDSTLPWENGGEKVSSDFTLFYQIVLGSINVTNAFSALNTKYTDSGVEAKVTSGEAIIAIIIVDQKGCVISGYNPINLASFAWGTPKALKGNIKELNRWSITESTVKIELGAIIRKINNNGEILPLNKLTIQEAYNYLVNAFDIPTEMLINKQFAIRSYEPHKEGSPANFPSKIPLLNSFYLKDIEKATKVIKGSKDNTNLLQYLGVNVPSNRYDILDDTVLADTLAPKNIPAARWPGSGRHPLVLLQQAAVNLAMTKLNDGGILAINGPPGTGKTTLLRDIVAELVSKRAEALLKFDDPEKAFTNSGNTVKSSSSQFDIYTLDESIKGFEILIASSNNKAVENISAELPNLKAIASDADDLRYFTPLSDALLGYSSWGLISAMLGNSSNRINFSKKFWRNQDFGIDTYLAEVNGSPQTFDEKDTVTKKITKTRKPQIIQDSNPPCNRSEALIRWRQVCNHFKHVLQASRTRLAELQEIKNLLQYLADIAIQLEPGEGLNDLLSKHNKHKPCIISSILKTSAFRSWQKKNQKLTNFQYTQKNIYELFSQLAPHIVDKNLFLKSPKEKYVVSPWCDAQTHSLRDEVFIAAIKVHKAFIDAAAKPLLHNLGAWMENFTNSTTVMECLADLWSSFFLVVPTISTTFASVERMLQGLPLNYLGWLLIDEAGQALPQAAVGAIMRTKRIIITGDPIQIEPIVTLPDSLTKNICKQFEVNPDNFNAPEASVQTLANAVSPYITKFTTKYGNRETGVPLLVHRRCADPMFSISNIIAYENLMIQIKKDNSDSLIRNCLGSSKWFDVKGDIMDKWCLEEGKEVIRLLNQLKTARIFPDLYIISPFKLVAYNLRKLIKEHKVLDSWIETDTQLWLNERIGTVHTVQGREAEAVILVLGAQGSTQGHSRQWAGKSPNILNVAVTRAKEVIYVIGHKDSWENIGVFRELYSRLEDDFSID